jgi:tetratricopeptide (TPR) repeat protein
MRVVVSDQAALPTLGAYCAECALQEGAAPLLRSHYGFILRVILRGPAAMTRLRCGLTLVMLGLLVIAIGSMNSLAQGTDDLARLRAQVIELHSQGKYAGAIPLAEQYVSLARGRHGEEHAEYSGAISLLAFLYQAEGRYADAESLYLRSFSIQEKILRPEHLDEGRAKTKQQTTSSIVPGPTPQSPGKSKPRLIKNGAASDWRRDMWR